MNVYDSWSIRSTSFMKLYTFSTRSVRTRSFGTILDPYGMTTVGMRLLVDASHDEKDRERLPTRREGCT